MQRPPQHSWISYMPQKQALAKVAWLLLHCVQLSCDGERCVLLLCA